MPYLLVQTVMVLATASEVCCTKATISFAAGCTIVMHSPLAIVCSSLLLCWLTGPGQGPEVCWSGSALRSRGLPTSYLLIPFERNPAKALPRSLRAFATWSFEHHWPLLLSGLYLFWTGRHGAETVLQLEIKLCHLESPLPKLEAIWAKRCRKISDAKSLHNILYALNVQLWVTHTETIHLKSTNGCSCLTRKQHSQV